MQVLDDPAVHDRHALAARPRFGLGQSIQPLAVVEPVVRGGACFVERLEHRVQPVAQVALVGLGANTPVESVYPVALATPSGETFNGANSYRMVFKKGKLPPTRAFWSLTMYDTDGYLVANPSNIYAIGDSHPPLRKKKDGSVVVVMQKDKPTEKDVNWLPAPADKGFRLNLRLYMPKKAILDGSWKPPGVEKAG